jgi:very-short-patch-repair endonuclease
MQPYNTNLTRFARTLRSNQTDAEQKLWSRLRRKQLLEVQFYRQKPIADFIVDFYCAAANLVIELDGSQHFEAEHKQNDAARDRVMQDLGLLVLRFDNRQVLLETDSVVAVIYQVLEQRIKK